MLELSEVDLGDLAFALDDHSYFGGWYIDASTGEVWKWSEEDDDPEFHPDNRPAARVIPPLPSGVGYRDMEDFIARVTDRRAAELLERAIAGRGAFRRFKDTLFEFPELREAWFTFRDVRMQRRAVEFLLDEGLVDDKAADAALAGLDDPPIAVGDRSADPRAVAAGVAADLRRLYGDRLIEVDLYGSHARGDAHADADLDLAVVLEGMRSPWEELRRMDEVLWRHTVACGLTISATPITRTEWAAGERPLVRAARAEAVRVD